jgi:hypothetical protein
MNSAEMMFFCERRRDGMHCPFEHDPQQGTTPRFQFIVCLTFFIQF